MNRLIVTAVLAVSALGPSQAAQAQSRVQPQLQTDSQRAGTAGEGYTQLLTDSQRRQSRQDTAGAAAGMRGGQVEAQVDGYAAQGEGQQGYGDESSRRPAGAMTSLGRAAAVDAVNAAAGIANNAIIRHGGQTLELYKGPDGIVRNRVRGGEDGHDHAQEAAPASGE
ncbi:hypothetical protein [Luteimonas aquatica]|uniref:hypothetical protein n=1 Tax=Luteimonas aquatica TaxID=450364 RepID=UPI001F565396|nr:hypothetical protein [Luteimonas aquatica]